MGHHGMGHHGMGHHGMSGSIHHGSHHHGGFYGGYYGGSGLGLYLSSPFGYGFSPYGYYGYSPYGSSFYGSPYGYARVRPYSSSVYLNVSPYLGTRYSSAYTPPITLQQNSLTQRNITVPETPAVIATSPSAAMFQRDAEQAFRDNRLQDADRLAGHAAVEDSKNGKVLLFAAQVKFALGEYETAANLIHQAATLLDPKDWGFVVENYQKFYRGQNYVQQMEPLVNFTRDNPTMGYAHFLRGYQYRYLGYLPSARGLLSRAVDLDRNDTMAAQLLASLPPEQPQPSAVAPTPAATDLDPPSLDPMIQSEPTPAAEVLPSPTESVPQ